MMNDALRVAGVVLAGGRSRRFGADKARYRIGGTTMVEHVASTLGAVCPTVLVSLGIDTSAFDLPDLRYVRDRYIDAGPLAGIHAALEAVDTPWLLVAACDMPFITPDALRRILAARDPGADAVVACDARGDLHPLCGCYRRDLLPRLSAFLDSGGRSARAFVAQITYTTVELDAGESLRNVNTPGDLTDFPPHGPGGTDR